jgi:hypothetical protein
MVYEEAVSGTDSTLSTLSTFWTSVVMGAAFAALP